VRPMDRQYRPFGLAIAAAKPPLAPNKEMCNPKACAHTRATVGEGGKTRMPEVRNLS